jgi:hypothetical protein
MRILKVLLISIILIIFSDLSICQSRWVHSYHDNEDVYLIGILESYDHGLLLSGKYGANYSKYNWLIKTDINGEVLWEKTIGDGNNPIAFLDITQDMQGNEYLCGGTSTYDPDNDPIVIKIDQCGNKEWCRILYKENHYSFATCLTLTPSGDVAVALFELNEPWVDRICLAKLSAEGDLIWKHCYTSADTSERNEDIYEVILTPDKGFLLTGFCYYEDPEIPDHWIIHPYLLKVDSLGNFQWETVVFKETNTDGGWAASTDVSVDQNYFYTSGSHYHFDSILTKSPALMKIDMMGNVIDVYDIVEGYKYGALNYAQFINDSTLAAEAGWANTEDENWSLAVIIDTLGKLINSTVLVEDSYTSHLDVTHDGKLVYASNTYQNGQFDCFLTKLNQNLEDDSLYTRFFTYDSLCPYQIVSDTIVQDDCGLIVGIEEDDRTVGLYDGKENELEIWPNPAGDIVNCQLSNVNGKKDISLMIYDIFGRTVLTPITSPSPLDSQFAGQKELGWQLDVSTLPSGIYFIVIRDERNVIGTWKFMVAR